MATRINPRQVNAVDESGQSLQERLKEISMLQGKATAASELPELADGQTALRYVEEESRFYAWKGQATGWEPIQAKSQGLSAEQKALIGDNIFDGTQPSSTSSLDGQIKLLNSEVHAARGTSSTLDDRLNSMTGIVEQSAVMLDEHSRYFKDHLQDTTYMDALKSNNVKVQGGYFAALKGGLVEDTFDVLDMVDTTNSLNLDTSAVGEVRLKSTATEGYLMSKTFTTGGTDRATLAASEYLPSAYAWGQVSLSYGTTHGYHFYDTFSVIDKNGRKWVFCRDNSNHIVYFIMNADGTIFKTVANAYSSYNSYNPKAAVDHDGNVWLLFANSYYDYMDMAFKPNGSVLYSASKIGQSVSYDSTNHAEIIVDDEGKIWHIMSSSNYWSSAEGNIYVYVRNPNNTVYGTRWIAAPLTYGNRIRPAATVDTNGRIWITFFNAGTNNYGNNTGEIRLYTGIYNPDLTEYKAPFLVNNSVHHRHPHYVSARMVATPTEVELFYNVDTGSIFYQRFNLSGGFVNSTYAVSKHITRNFSAGTSTYYTGVQSTYRGFRFTMTRDSVFHGFQGRLGTSSSSYNSTFEFILMKKEASGWVELLKQSYTNPSSNSSGWQYVNANQDIILQKGEQYAVMFRGTGNYSRHWYDTTPPSWPGNTYGSFVYDYHCYAHTSSVNNVVNWGYCNSGIGMMITDSLAAIKTTGTRNELFNSALYDEQDGRTYLAYASEHDGQAGNDIYAGYMSPAGSYGSLVDEQRIMETGNNGENYPSLARDYLNNAIHLDWSGVDPSVYGNWQVYTAQLAETESKITYELSNNGGVNWVTAKPGETISFSSVGTEFKVKANFWTSVAGVVPRLLGYSIDEFNSTAGDIVAEFVSEQLPSTAPITRATINANQATRGGTIEYFLSNDGGFTWVPTSPGVAVDFVNSNSSDLRIKAKITVPASESLSPVVYDYAVTSTSLPSNRRLVAAEINLIKTNFKLATFQKATRYALKNMIIDSLEDESGMASLTDVVIANSKAVVSDAFNYDLSTDGTTITSSVGSYNTTTYDITNVINRKISTSYQDGWLQGNNSTWDSTSTTAVGAEIDLTFAAAKEISKIEVLMNDGDGTGHGYCDHQIEVYNPATLAWDIVVPRVNLATEFDLGTEGNGWWRYELATPVTTDKIRVRAWAKTTYGTINEVYVHSPKKESGQLVTVTESLDITPTTILLTAEEVLNTGSISYEISRDDGITWIPVTRDVLKDINELAAGQNLVIKATITGNAELYALGYSWS